MIRTDGDEVWSWVRIVELKDRRPAFEF